MYTQPRLAMPETVIASKGLCTPTIRNLKGRCPLTHCDFLRNRSGSDTTYRTDRESYTISVLHAGRRAELNAYSTDTVLRNIGFALPTADRFRRRSAKHYQLLRRFGEPNPTGSEQRTSREKRHETGRTEPPEKKKNPAELHELDRIRTQNRHA